MNISQELWQQAYNLLDEAIFLVQGEELQIMDCNLAALRLLGYHREALFRLPFTSLVTEEDWRLFAITDEPISRQELVHLLGAAGQVILVTLSWTCIPYSDPYWATGMIIARRRSGPVSSKLAQQEATQKLRFLIDQSPVGITMVDEFGTIIEWNSAEENISGFSAENVLGRPLWEVRYEMTPPALRSPSLIEELKNEIEGTVQTGWHSNLGILDLHQVARVDGPQRWIETIKFPIYTDRGSMFASVSMDVTEREKALAEARRQADRTETLARVAAFLNANSDIHAMMQFLCEEVSRALNVPAVTITLVDEDEEVATLVAESGLSEWLRENFPVIPASVYDTGLRAFGTVYTIPDLREATDIPYINNRFTQEDICSVLAIVMTYEARAVGSLNVFTYHTAKTFSPEDIALAKAIADQAAIALMRTRYVEKVVANREQLRALSNRLVDIAEQERRAIARELHDEVGQNLTSLKLALDLETTAPVHDPAKQMVVQLIEQVRTMSLQFRPSVLDDLGVRPALEQLFERYQAQTRIQVHFQHADIDRRFSSQVESTVYRVVQEALTNIARYAETQEVWVRIWVLQNELFFQIEDRGKGFVTTEALASTDHTGLFGMRERVSLCQGVLEIHSTPGEGTFITARVPVDYLPQGEDQ